MKVYVVVEHPEYEGGGSYYGTSTIHGVFSTEEKAKEFDEELKALDSEIMEFTLE